MYVKRKAPTMLGQSCHGGRNMMFWVSYIASFIRDIRDMDREVLDSYTMVLFMCKQ